MNEEDKDKNEDIQTIDVSEDTSNENKSTDDQIALRVFQYIKDFIFCVGTPLHSTNLAPAEKPIT